MITKRIDTVTGMPEEYLNTIIPAPKSVKIEMTSRCNFACSFCAHQQGQKQHGDIDWDLFTRVCREMRNAGVEELGVFYIGESMMYPRLAEAIQYAKDIGFPYVFLTTNGSVGNADKYMDIMEAGLDSLKFSFNNADGEQLYNVAKMPPATFERIKNNIKEARMIRDDGGYKTRLYASSIKYDGNQQRKMEKAVDEIRPYVDEHYWLPLLSFGDQATKQEKEMGLNPTVGNPGRLDCMRPPLPCWAVFREGHITHDGKLSACCFDGSDKWEMANLNHKSFRDGWNSMLFQKLREAHLNKNVRNTPCEACIHGSKK